MNKRIKRKMNNTGEMKRKIAKQKEAILLLSNEIDNIYSILQSHGVRM